MTVRVILEGGTHDGERMERQDGPEESIRFTEGGETYRLLTYAGHRQHDDGEPMRTVLGEYRYRVVF